MSWHVGQDVAIGYANAQLDRASAASVEAHVLGCAACRSVVIAAATTAIGGATFDALWDDIVDTIDQPRVGWIERILRRIGISEASARLVAAAPRARIAYLVAVALSLMLALLAVQAPYDDLFGTFLVAAPLGPLVATAVSFSRLSDPAFELLGTVPTSPLRVLLTRTVAAVLPALALTAVSFAWTAERGWLAAAWLLPSLAVSTMTLALATWIAVERAALVVGAVWIATPFAVRTDVGALLDAFGARIQIGSIVVLAAAAAVVVVRQSAIEYRET
jgi:hypothetical protein